MSFISVRIVSYRAFPSCPGYGAFPSGRETTQAPHGGIGGANAGGGDGKSNVRLKGPNSVGLIWFWEVYLSIFILGSLAPLFFGSLKVRSATMYDELLLGVISAAGGVLMTRAAVCDG